MLENLRDLQRFADHTWRTANLGNNRSVVLKRLEETRWRVQIRGQSIDTEVDSSSVLISERQESWYTFSLR